MVNHRRLQFAFFTALFCALVMLFEDIGEAMGVAWIDEWDEIHVWEVMIVGLLFLTIVLIGIEVRKLRAQNASLEGRAARASGAFQDLLNG